MEVGRWGQPPGGCVNYGPRQAGRSWITFRAYIRPGDIRLASVKQSPIFFYVERIHSISARDARAAVPARWRNDVARVLIGEAQLSARVRALSREIERDYRGREMVIVSLLNGTVMFLADLVRHVSLPLRLDFIGVSSYGNGRTPGRLVFTKELRLDVHGRDVLLVDDILDTGRTMTRVLARLRRLRPRRIRICVLLNKPARRIENVRAHYVGFDIPDEFVVGYGLDYAERYRNLPFVGVLQPHVYRTVNGAGTET